MCDPHRPGGNELQKYNQASNTIEKTLLLLTSHLSVCVCGFVQEDEAGTV